MFIRFFLVLCLALVVVACASQGKRGPGGPHGPVAGANVNKPSALLAKARDVQAREGCGKAAPTYRVVASFGAGYEIAQYELGDCLLKLDGASVSETALFRDEALFWLNRAAWAGNPRAQLKLAEILSGAVRYGADHVSADPQQAMMWSAVYEQNGARETFGLKPVGPVVTAHLQSVLTAQAIEAARAAAEEFQKIEMAEFVPLAQERAQQPNGGRFHQRAPDGRRRPH